MYRPLTGQSFRILVIQKGAGSELIGCRLVHAARRTLQYDALSYEWDSASLTDPFITVDGQLVKVRENLFKALYAIRQPDKDRHVWIDALCIDQANMVERNAQVRMMNETYKDAGNVLIWLGSEKDGSDLAMRIAQETSNSNDIMKSLQPHAIDAITAICERTYWRRVWMQQEIHLAQSLLIYCGDQQVSGDIFNELLMSGIMMLPLRYSRRIQEGPANSIMSAKRTDRSYNDLSSWIRLCIRMDLGTSEPRDIVFAMLGISNDCQSGEILPNYDMSLEDVYFQAIAFCEKSKRTHDNDMEDMLWFRRTLAEKIGLSFESVESRLPMLVGSGNLGRSHPSWLELRDENSSWNKRLF